MRARIARRGSADVPRVSGSQRLRVRFGADAICGLIILAATLGVWGPALFTGRVLLPADIVPLMPPWAATAAERFPDYRFAQNQLHGPIFEYYSWRYYARERLRVGEVPLWNPNELGGNVLLANSQSAVLYPLNLLLYVLPLWVGINLVTALHTLLTGLFMYALLRGIGLRPVAGLTGALVWMFCGLQIVWTEFQTPTAALCWLPAMLWTWELGRRNGDWRWAVFGSGSAICLTLLAGHLQFAFYAILAFLIWALGRGVIQAFMHRLTPSSPHPFILLMGTLAFGIGLSLSTMLPVMEMSRTNFRGEDTSYGASIALRLPPENLFTLVQPNLFGNPRDYVGFDADGRPANGHSYWGKFDFIEYTGYVGIPALILALVGLLYAFVRRGARSQECGPRWYWAVLALAGLLLALGTPLCALFFYGLPGYKQFHATARALTLFSFGMAGLSALGVQALADRGRASRLVSRFAVCATVLVLAAGLTAFPGMGLAWRTLFTDQWFGYELAGLGRFSLFVILTAMVLGLLLARRNVGAVASSSAPSTHPLLWLLPALCLADLVVWGEQFNSVTEPGMLGYATETTQFLRTTAPDRAVSLETPGRGIKSFIVPNYNAVCGYREVQGADSLHTARIHHLMEQVVRSMGMYGATAFPDPNTIHVPSIDHPVFDLLNVRYVATLRDLNPARFERVRTDEMTIYRNPRAMGRAWVVGGAERVADVGTAVRRLAAPDFDARRTALIERGVGPLDPAASGSPVSITSFDPHRIEVQADSRGAGLLVLSEIAFPGWRAMVDGRPAPIVTADWILRSVPIGPGSHRIVLTYDSASYRLGLYLSATALMILGACLAYRIPRPRPES